MEIKGIITIQPKFALGIVKGFKRIEWRKKNSFSNLNHFLCSKNKKLNLLMYVTSPVKSPCIVVETSNIEIGDPIEIFNKNASIAGISYLDILSYYGGKHTIDKLYNYSDNTICEKAYVIYIKHCYLIHQSILTELVNYITEINLSILKGIRSVQEFNYTINNNMIYKIW
ncbi:hypothetical protein SAMN05660649_00531 [Desulfotomaculum arcticum]|uniref:ASCH domain-containing protein n=1 Tax=Desulfotruncus arcticus DSM 17038 TaxID=1121424 RepID=A0A1I2NRZ7_9FIRM|nr:hypothetical protein [Desulfotruncus arcticus]SFG06353.1 hypothetical protein SAMN05660649_00531 [Desulfotomaculum arcticum] [Desulfotruncus arcticus DSM 17038]